MKSEEFEYPRLAVPHSSSLRVLSSSLFAYLLVAIGGYFVTNGTAKQIAGSESGIVYNIVQVIAWLLAGFAGGFVAGYRAAGRGWAAGFLVGLFTVTSLLGLMYWILSSEGMEFGDLFLLMSKTEQLAFWSLIALNIPSCTFGGMLGDQYFQEEGIYEDSRRHTLFRIPWWHWLWLLVFLPSVVVSDLVLSGHLLILGLRLTWTRLIHLDFSESLLLDIAPIIGFLATGYGFQNLWDALSVRTDMPTGKRIGKAVWGVVLLVFIVSVVWRISSSMLVSAINEH